MPKLEEAIKELESSTKDGKTIADILSEESENKLTLRMSKMLDGFVALFGDKIDALVEERVKDKTEEMVSMMLSELRGPKGEDGSHGRTPTRGVDYLTDEEISQIKEELKPQKDIDYFDGKHGKSIVGPPGPQGLPGKNGADAKVDAKIIVKLLESLKGNERLSASAIKDMREATSALGGISRHRGGVGLVFNEQPSGTKNGSNVTFTTAFIPKSGTLQLYLNGSRSLEGASNDFTLSGSTITLANAPLSGDNLVCDYAKQ